MKKNGFTFIEIMIVVAIVAILASMATVSFAGRGAKNAAAEVQVRGPLIISEALNRSFETGEERNIRINLDDESILIRNADDSATIGRLKLPDVLTYSVRNDTEGSIIATTGTLTIPVRGNGGVNLGTWSISDGDGINIGVYDSMGAFVARIRIRNIPGVRVGVVELYKNSWDSNPIKI